MNSPLKEHRVLLRWTAALFFLAAVAQPASARKSESWARTQFAAAERMREALNGRPLPERTRRDYQKTISAYRAVYYGSPVSAKADPSVVAVAELRAEMGRRLHDAAASRAAIREYEFLRKEYPGSRYRFEALFTIAEIYKDDLNDAARARTAFAEFIKRYPRHHLADEARQALNDEELQAKAKPAVSPGRPQHEKTADTIAAKNEKLPRITGIRHWSTPDYTRVAVDLEQDVKFDSQRIANPDRIFFDLPDTQLSSTLVGKTFDVDDNFLKKIRVAQFESGHSRIVLEVDDLSKYNAFLLSNPSRLIIDIHGHGPEDSEAEKKDDAVRGAGPVLAKAEVAQARADAPVKNAPVKNASIKKKIVEADDDDDQDAAPADVRGTTSGRGTQRPGIREARPNARGDRSLIRALGLKIGKIVIDPGHGGHDAGTIGPNGLQEKELVLDVSRRLGRLLETRLGAEVDFTRRDDTFIPLETRTAIANQDQADLFISVHANSSRDPDARGVETYYLNFTSSPEALETAARENAVSEKSIHELQDLVKKIALKEKIEESREFASNVESSLHSGLAAKNPGLRDRGVKKAPFIVLIGANMPSILAEISFVSNPADERWLQTAEYRQRIAESLYRGISQYVGGLSGVKVASRIEKSAGQ